LSKIRYTFDIFNSDEIFDILVLEKRIRIHVDRVISSSKELGKYAYYKWHDSFSHNTCDCDVFHRQLQSAIDEGMLKFRDHLDTRGHISHSQILPNGIINLEARKILVRPSQAETIKGKNVIICESREKVRPITKKPKPTFGEPSAKCKKGNANIKSRQTRTVRKVKPELPVSSRQADNSVAGRLEYSKQLKSSSEAKLHSQDQRDRKLYTTTLFPPFRHPMPKSWVPSPMMFHPYDAWFSWYASPMQYESFYPRSTKHEPNAFDRSVHPRKDRFYPKSRLNATKIQEQPNQTFQFGNPEVSVFPARVGHIGLKKAYHVKQKPNSNESLNLNTQGEKSIFANEKKQQQLADSNSCARTREHELEKGLFPIVSANKPTGQNAKSKEDVPTSFNRPDMLAKL
jgi:hypothetical protein